jgi:hypothetical protein
MACYRDSFTFTFLLDVRINTIPLFSDNSEQPKAYNEDYRLPTTWAMAGNWTSY